MQWLIQLGMNTQKLPLLHSRPPSDTTLNSHDKWGYGRSRESEVTCGAQFPGDFRQTNDTDGCTSRPPVQAMQKQQYQLEEQLKATRQHADDLEKHLAYAHDSKEWWAS